MGVRTTLLRLLNSLLSLLPKKVESSTDAAPAAVTPPTAPEPEDAPEDEPLPPRVCDRFFVTDDAEIDYVDRNGAFTRRKIRTSEVYRYDDGVTVIRAYCKKREGWRTFVSKRVQYWKAGLSGEMVSPASLGDYLRKKSEGDPDQVAQDIYQEFIAEIACGIGSLMRYDENKSVDRRVITGQKKTALLNWVVTQGDAPALLDGLTADDRLNSRDALEELVVNTKVDDTSFSIGKRTMRNKRSSAQKKALIEFVSGALEGVPARDSAVGLLKDEILTPSFKVEPQKEIEGDKVVLPFETLQEEEVAEIKAEAKEKPKTTRRRRKSKTKKTAVDYRGFARKDAIYTLTVAETKRLLGARLNAGNMVFDKELFHSEVSSLVMSLLTPEEVKDEGELLQHKINHGISLGYCAWGIKKKDQGWYVDENGREVLDLRNSNTNS